MGFQIRLTCRMLPDAGRGGHADLKDESLLLDTHGGDGKRDFPFSRFASRRSLLLVALGSVGTSYGIGLPVPRMGALNEDSHLSSGLPRLSTHGVALHHPVASSALGARFFGFPK